MSVAFPVEIRPLEERDVGFCVGFWLDSLFYGNGDPKEPRSVFKKRERPEIERMLRSDLTVVACDPRTGGEILFGFACGSPSALHYVYALQTRRRGGLGRALVRELMARGCVPSTHTYSTRAGRHWWRGAGQERAA